MRLPSLTPTRPAAPRAAVRLLSTARSGFPLFSPSDLMTFAESPWASWMERHSRERPEHPLSSRADPPDAFMQMLGQKGAASEAALLQDAFVSQGRTVIDLSAERGSKEARARCTSLALAERPDIIYQAPLLGRGFFGVADFLVRDESSGGYTVWDAKLSRTARPSHALQLCCYADMLAQTCPEMASAQELGLVLGGSIDHVLPLRLDQYAAHYRHVREAFVLTLTLTLTLTLPLTLTLTLTLTL